VDKDVDMADAGQYLDYRLRVGQIADHTVDTAAPVAALLVKALERQAIPRQRDNAKPVIREPHRDGTADPSRPASYKRRPVLHP
jgi:hypothetical protein